MSRPNHLDLATKEMLIGALKDFEGTMNFRIPRPHVFCAASDPRVLELGGETGRDPGKPRVLSGILY